MVHAVGRYALEVCGADAGAFERVVFEDVVGYRPAPCVALYALGDVGRCVVVVGHKVGLKHFQTERHAAAVRQAGHCAHEFLGETFAVAQPR